MEYKELRKQLVIAAQRAYNRGIQTNNGGNLSARIPGKELMLIKGARTSFIDSGEDSFVISDWHGNPVGEGTPSRESKLHGFIYENLPEVNAIVHTHSVYSIAWASLKRNDLVQVTHHSAMKIGGDVPVFVVESPAVLESDFPIFKKAFDEGSGKWAFILWKHGVFGMGKDPIAAEHTAELVEETARIAVIELMLGSI